MSKKLSLALVVATASCSHPAMDPHGSSATQHDMASWEHAVAGQAHAQQCRPEVAPCWRSNTTASDPHVIEARRHDEAALQHALAGVELREAERRACAGLSDEDRAESPFVHRDDVSDVGSLVDGGRVVGAVVTFRAVRGLTRARLQELVDCHVARVAALGHEDPGMPECPLLLRGTTATVRDEQNGLSVEIRGGDPQAAAEIMTRARRLRPAGTPMR